MIGPSLPFLPKLFFYLTIGAFRLCDPDKGYLVQRVDRIRPRFTLNGLFIINAVAGAKIQTICVTTHET